MKKTFALVILVGITTAFHAQTLLIDDPLTNGTTVGQVVHQNPIPSPTFTTEGWQPGASIQNQNHILYDIPYYIKEGYMEFEIKGMQNPSSGDNDPGFCALYDGRGISENIHYFDDFKQNFYRWNIHFRGDSKVFKCKIQMPNNTEENETRAKAVYLVDAAGAYNTDSKCLTEPNGSSQTWSKTTWYTIKVEWKNKNYKVYVNGTQKWGVTLSTCDFDPRDMKVWLGCAPGDTITGKYTALIPGLTFRNFKFYTWDNLEANISSGSVNIPPTGYLGFGKIIQDDVITKSISIQNLKANAITVSISASNANYTPSITSVTLQPNEKKEITVSMKTNTAGAIKGVLTLSSADWAASRTVSCVGDVISKTLVVDEYEDQFNDNTVSGMYTKEFSNTYYSFSETNGSTMKIAVTKQDASYWRRGFYFNTTLPSPFYINMSDNPFISLKVKSTKDIVLAISPNNVDQPTAIQNSIPFEDSNSAAVNVPGDGQWHVLNLDYTQPFIHSQTKADLINKIWFCVNYRGLITADVEFDYLLVGKKARPITFQTEQNLEASKFIVNQNLKTINLQGLEKNSSIQIFDIYGRKVLSEVTSNNDKTIELGNLGTGIYAIWITCPGKQILREKFILR